MPVFFITNYAYLKAQAQQLSLDVKDKNDEPGKNARGAGGS